MQLSPLADFLVTKLDKAEALAEREDMEVNPIISEVAAWYEKLRNALEYKEEEVILRAAIERILRRRLVLDGKKAIVGAPLIRELVWAKYFPEGSIPDEIIKKVEDKVQAYLALEDLINKKHRINRGVVYEWIMHLMSADIERVLRLDQQKDLVSNFIYQVFRKKVVLSDENEQTRDAQVFVAVRRAFAKEDLAMLRFGLFSQYFGVVNAEKIERISDEFIDAHREIDKQLSYLLKDRIYAYIKGYMPAFYILEDVFNQNKGNIKAIVEDESKLTGLVLKTCTARYLNIEKRVSTAILRSVIFIFLTKAIFALTVETAAENYFYGAVNWMAIGINTVFSPLLMVSTALFIKIPGMDNSQKILHIIKQILSEENPNFAKPLILGKNSHKLKVSLWFIYSILWLFALGCGLMAINYGLSLLHFNVISKIVFIFFLAVVSFMSYRISRTSRLYSVEKERHGIRAILFDFFFMPFIQLGKYLTVGVSQINIFLFIFDYIIEAPFKEMFSFFEQWLFFLRSQRETLD